MHGTASDVLRYIGVRELFGPVYRDTAYGGVLAATPPGCPLNIAVIGADNDDADQQFDVAVASWLRLLPDAQL